MATPHSLGRFQKVWLRAERGTKEDGPSVVARAPDGRFVLWDRACVENLNVEPGDLVETLIIACKDTCYVGVPLHVFKPKEGVQYGPVFAGRPIVLEDGELVIVVEEGKTRLLRLLAGQLLRFGVLGKWNE